MYIRRSSSVTVKAKARAAKPRRVVVGNDKLTSSKIIPSILIMAIVTKREEAVLVRRLQPMTMAMINKIMFNAETPY